MVHEARKSRFSWITDGTGAASDSVWDREIASTPNFIVTPSMGSLVPGWVLAVPRKPLVNLGKLDSDARMELEMLTQSVAKIQAAFGGDIYCFEHGADHLGSLTGCGVDQAHLHIVPLSFDLLSAAKKAADPHVKWGRVERTASALTLLPNEGEYIAIWRVRDGRGILGTVSTPSSQWVRRLIAQNLGIEDEWNYRTHPQAEIVNQTIAMWSATTSVQAPK